MLKLLLYIESGRNKMIFVYILMVISLSGLGYSIFRYFRPPTPEISLADIKEADWVPSILGTSFFDEKVREVMISGHLTLHYSKNKVFVKGYVGEYIIISSSIRKGEIRIFLQEERLVVVYIGSMTHYPYECGWATDLYNEVHSIIRQKAKLIP